MSSGRNDIRLIELKDTISQLNQTIRVQTEMIKDLRKTIEEHHASDEKKDQIISNLQAEISYLKAKLFGASSEKRRLKKRQDRICSWRVNIYPDERINFLSKQSCSNFYKLTHDLKDHSCCLALGQEHLKL